MPVLVAFLGLAVAQSFAVAGPFDRERIGNADVSVERGFARVGYGQLHYRVARPTDPSQVAKRSVVCFHQTPISSQIYVEFMSELARDRIVYAVDTPGQGESDLPGTPPEISDYATAMIEFLALKDLDAVDLVGYHTGASIAVEVANGTEDAVQNMMLVGIALFDEKERQAFFDEPWPKPRAEDGSHLLTEWQRSQHWRGPGQTDESVARTFLQKLLPGDTAWWGARAVMRHDLAGALRQSAVPFVAVNSKDDLFQITPRVKEIRPEVEVVTYEDRGFGIFEVQPKVMAALARKTFDQGPANDPRAADDAPSAPGRPARGSR